MTDRTRHDNTTSNDPAVIERDIRRTQEDMSRTVDKIGDQLTIKNVFNALLDKADENGVDANYLIDGARRNPMALGLIAAGAIWLVSDKDSKFPSMPHKSKGDGSDGFDFEGHDVHHRDYVAHMSAFEMRDGEDLATYQRRRDVHRANFLMCEQRPQEDEQSFRDRLDDLTEKFREKRSAWSDSAGETASATKRRTQQFARQASSRAQDLYLDNPLVGGILAAAVGAAFGSTIPVSRTEEEALGGVGAKAREKKDELLEKADQKLERQGKQGQPEPAFQGSGNQSTSQSQSGGERRSPSEGPFIMPDRTR